MKWLILTLAVFLLVSASCSSNSKERAALTALKKLQAYVEVGPVRLHYKELLGEARYAVNEAVGTISPDSPELHKILYFALSSYDQADRDWGRFGSDNTARDELLGVSWDAGANWIKKAEEKLN